MEDDQVLEWYDHAKFPPFLMEVIPVIRLLDIRILLPTALHHPIRPMPTVRPILSFQLLQTALAEQYEGASVELSDEVRALIRELTGTCWSTG